MTSRDEDKAGQSSLEASTPASSSGAHQTSQQHKHEPTSGDIFRSTVAPDTRSGVQMLTAFEICLLGVCGTLVVVLIPFLMCHVKACNRRKRQRRNFRVQERAVRFSVSPRLVREPKTPKLRGGRGGGEPWTPSLSGGCGGGEPWTPNLRGGRGGGEPMTPSHIVGRGGEQETPHPSGVRHGGEPVTPNEGCVGGTPSELLIYESIGNDTPIEHSYCTSARGKMLEDQGGHQTENSNRYSTLSLGDEVQHIYYKAGK
ncbi:uncharacterized protein [Asterias amurensis]|uniref:uncharacterized protein n=1 Tax=Asterias amurensis TaxID=7602 RepID=UPI003AB128F7